MNSAGDPSEQDLLHRELQDRPRSVRAHFALGRFHADAGQSSLARTYYRQGLALAVSEDRPEAPAVEQAAAEVALAEIERTIADQRDAILAERGFAPADRSPRLQASLLEQPVAMAGAAQSSPTDFHYQGLEARPFHDPLGPGWNWVGKVEAATPIIRDELMAELRSSRDQFRAYIDRHSVVPEVNDALLGSKQWSILALCERSWIDVRVVQRFQRTWAAILQAPLPAIYGWGPTVVISRLAADRSAPWHVQHPVDLSLAAHRSVRMRLSGRQRGPRVGGREADDLRRHVRTRGMERWRRRSLRPDLRYLAA